MVAQVERVRKLIARGAPVNFVGVAGAGALALACFNNDELMVAELLAAGADKDTDAHGSPLHLAIMRGLDKIVEMLVAAGAEMEKRNGCGWTPLLAACYCGQLRIARILVEAGADLEARDKVGTTVVG